MCFGDVSNGPTLSCKAVGAAGIFRDFVDDLATDVAEVVATAGSAEGICVESKVEAAVCWFHRRQAWIHEHPR
jgi:hypothetical protein